MKLLLLSDLNSIHTKKWVSGLAARGCEILVFGLSEPRDEYYVGLKDVRIEYANQSNIKDRSRFSKLGYLKHAKKVKQICREFKPDIVHAHYATSYGLLGSLLRQKPFLISVWGTEIFDFPKASALNRILLKRNLAKATHLFSTSKRMAEETKLYTNKKVEVVPFGVDVSRFKEMDSATTNAASDTMVIGIIKTLEKNYGIDYLLEAFADVVKRFPERNFELHIAGEGREEGALKRLAKELELTDKVFFRGFITHDKVPDCFNEMDIAVISSLAESFGVSAVEASACGKPVVATSVGGLPEVVVDQKTGLLCEPANAKDLADKLSILVADEEKRKAYGKAGRQFVLENYDWEKNVDLMLKYYQEILSF